MESSPRQGSPRQLRSRRGAVTHSTVVARGSFGTSGLPPPRSSGGSARHEKIAFPRIAPRLEGLRELGIDVALIMCSISSLSRVFRLLATYGDVNRKCGLRRCGRRFSHQLLFIFESSTRTPARRASPSMTKPHDRVYRLPIASMLSTSWITRSLQRHSGDSKHGALDHKSGARWITRWAPPKSMLLPLARL